MNPATTPDKKHETKDNNGSKFEPIPATAETHEKAPGEKTPKKPDPNRFTEVVTERGMYNVDDCKDMPLIGYLIDYCQMPPGKFGEWSAFVIRITEPGLACDRDGEVYETHTGEEVVIPATYQLMQFMKRMAMHRSLSFEVRIAPGKKIETKSGSMWTYKLGINPNGVTHKSLGIEMIKSLPQDSRDIRPIGAPSRDGGEIPF